VREFNFLSRARVNTEFWNVLSFLGLRNNILRSNIERTEIKNANIPFYSVHRKTRHDYSLRTGPYSKYRPRDTHQHQEFRLSMEFLSYRAGDTTPIFGVIAKLLHVNLHFGSTALQRAFPPFRCNPKTQVCYFDNSSAHNYFNCLTSSL
jgi:hypothetical protein